MDNELVFQVIDWDENDIIIEESLKYIILAYGRTFDNKSVVLQINNYKPYFYVKNTDNSLMGKIRVNCDVNNMLSKFNIIKKEFYGYNKNNNFKYHKLVFDNLKEYNKAIKYLSSIKCDLYEANFNTFLKYIHYKKLTPSGCIKVTNYLNNELLQSTCNINIECHFENTSYYDTTQNSPLYQCSFDIETNSSTGKFPHPSIEGDLIIQIGTTFKNYQDDDFKLKHIITIKECSNELLKNDPLVKIKSVKTEQELILHWAKLIEKEDPDIIYHYNGDWFDWWYIYERAKRYGKIFVKKFLSLLSRIKPHINEDPTYCTICDKKLFNSKTHVRYSPCNYCAYYYEKEFSSSAYGTSKYRRIGIPGRINFDILIYIQREYKEKMYTLNYISERFLKEKKEDLNYNKMFEIYKRGNPEDIELIAKYCIKDSVLPIKLVDKLFILQNQISMSNVTLVPIKFLIERGQQIKVFSQILKYCNSKDYILPTLKEQNKEITDIEDTFQGATVFEPDTGAYMQPVTVCDFASLYPSIIRSNNLCYTTYIKEKDKSIYENDSDLDILKVKCGEKIHYFVQNTESILPDLLAELAKSRKMYKNKMYQTNDEFEKQIYDKMQLAYKVSMNSVYGFLAAQMLTCKPIAESVTSIGRIMLEKSRDFILTNYPNSKVIYGDTDSLFIIFDTPNLSKLTLLNEQIKNGLEIKEKYIESIRKLEIKCREEAKEYGMEAAKQITKKLFKEPVALEYEKIYYPFIIVSKKRYFGGYYSNNMEKYDMQHCKGLLPTRRDNCELATEIFNKGIDLFVTKGQLGLNEYITEIRELVSSIKNNNIDISKFIIIKKLNDSYQTKTIDNHKGPFKLIGINNSKTQLTIKKPSAVNISQINQDFTIILNVNSDVIECKVTKAIIDDYDNIVVLIDNPIQIPIEIPKTTRAKGQIHVTFKGTVLEPNQPHVVLSRKLTERCPENPPKTNDRIPYIFIKVEGKNVPLFKKVEDPEYAVRHNLKIDPKYYIDAIGKPVGQVLDLFDDTISKELFSV